MKTAKTPILDIHLAAFLDLHGIPPDLSKQGTRVVFEFPSTPEVSTLTRAFNENPSVKILDYVHHLRKTRSMMLSAR
jgi:hypothetical protein